MTESPPRIEPRPDAGSAVIGADLGWALGVIFRRYAKQTAAALGDVPGGVRGYQVLAAAMAAGPRRQLELAGRLGIDRTVMTYLLDDLEQAGLVQRRPDPADRRARLIAVTEPGEGLLCDLQRRLLVVEEDVLGNLDEDERAAFRLMLRRIAQQADEADPQDACTVARDARDAAETC